MSKVRYRTEHAWILSSMNPPKIKKLRVYPDLTSYLLLTVYVVFASSK